MDWIHQRRDEPSGAPEAGGVLAAGSGAAACSEAGTLADDKALNGSSFGDSASH